MKRKKCKTCGKRWCGTNDRVKELYTPEEIALQVYPGRITYGSRACRDRANAEMQPPLGSNGEIARR